MNMPWCDNSSRWSMGLVKRVDYNGRIKQLKPKWVVPSNDGGPGIVARKINLRGSSDDTIDTCGNALQWTSISPKKTTSIPGTPTTFITMPGVGMPKFLEVLTK